LGSERVACLSMSSALRISHQKQTGKAMLITVLGLACLCCMGNGDRLQKEIADAQAQQQLKASELIESTQSVAEVSQDSSRVNAQDMVTPLSKLALLLTGLGGAAAFKPVPGSAFPAKSSNMNAGPMVPNKWKQQRLPPPLFSQMWGQQRSPITAMSSKADSWMQSVAADPSEQQKMMDAIRGKNLNTAEEAEEGMQFEFVEFSGDEELPTKYDAAALQVFFSKRPEVIVQRLGQAARVVSPFLYNTAVDIILNRAGDPEIQTQRAADLRRVVTRLGPFFIKLGQALSIRPDILPPDSMKELQKLCDKVPTFDSKLAMQIITDELGQDPEELFSELSAEPLAAASLGQVYKGKLRATGEVVAIKVQRPFVLETVSLDLYLFRQVGGFINSLSSQGTDLVALVDEFAGRFYDELDYNVECANGIRMAEDMASLPKVVIPKCFPAYTSRRVHTAAWIDGEKLADSQADDVQDLINVGVVAYLTQLLGAGFFHADPHPGNMLRTSDGNLAIIDFGLVTELTEDQRSGILESIVHLINRDYKQIGKDFQRLDFIPPGVDVTPIEPALSRVFDAALKGGGAKSINFNDLSDDLATLTFDYPFRIPPYFALVIRAISVLEGLALVGNPDFAIIDEAFPYISQRLLSADSAELQETLREFIYDKEGIFDAERLIELLGAFESFDITSGNAGGYTYGTSDVLSQESKVSTALSFFFSEKGNFLREFLLEEAVRGYDVFSRDALQRLRAEVPALERLVPGRRALLPDLTSQEEKTLLSTKALLDFFLASSGGNPIGSSDARSETAATLQRLSPVFQQYARPMNDFGLQVVGRLSEIYAVRLIRQTANSLMPRVDR